MLKDGDLIALLYYNEDECVADEHSNVGRIVEVPTETEGATETRMVCPCCDQTLYLPNTDDYRHLTPTERAVYRLFPNTYFGREALE